jgi:hypothetical protein
MIDISPCFTTNYLNSYYNCTHERQAWGAVPFRLKMKEPIFLINTVREVQTSDTQTEGGCNQKKLIKI